MELTLFGEVRLTSAGESLDVGTPRQQAVLAALAVDVGRAVSVETLVDRVWGEQAPTQARNVLYSHLSRIRRLLAAAGDGEITRRNAGYLLTVDPNTIDLHRFTRLVDSGKDTGRPDSERAAAVAEALRMWTDAPLAGLSGDWVDEVRAMWRRHRLDAVVLWAGLELRLGRPDAVIGPLSALADAYPLVEPLEVLLIRALHAAGRGAEAIDRYAVVRRRLADELGADPGPELRHLHSALLRGELPAASRPAAVTAPAQLPPDIPGFAGRATALRRLDSLLAEKSTATRTVVLSGTAGVGKTTLAVHWAHAVSDRFPDGQLYVNLRGFDPAGSPVTAVEATRGFLEALDVPPNRIPNSLDAQVGLYRTQLAKRRMLILLDNAHDAEQVRPLLPGAPDCLVLVTSRHQLTGLAAAGAHLIEVGLFDDAESLEMLRARLRADRIAAEPAAVREIIDLCACLPLALAVLAARAAAQPTFGLDTFAAQLRDARGSLDEFAGTDPATDPRAVFSWSYRRLSQPAARLFRLLGLHPGPDIGTAAAASLAATPAGRIRPVLAELTQAHLIAETVPGRYACHDLLRAYAAELAAAEESPADREAALRRLLGHYSRTAYHAEGFLGPRREVPPTPTPLWPGTEPEPIADHKQALAWYQAERRVLLSAVRQPPAYDHEVCDLVRWTHLFLEMQGHWHDELAALESALAAADRLGDERKQAFAHCQLGRTYIWFGRYAEADQALRAALDRYRA
ncbi:MAG TPA: BTAD domain-containing putative transcriptional regulator, partial [Kutzneria sp.]|nr:BTAD domain-containing putative transcriptional regulator [Kutzneria sp.]